MSNWLPVWLRSYRREKLPGDLVAGLIVTAMLVPQSLAYAMLAGMPPETGLYASMLPLLAYALLGSSMTLAVGPVAVISLMTATALSGLAAPGSAAYVALAGQLALISGGLLLVFGLLRLGFMASLLSHTVIAGFISGSAVLITIGQAKHLFGVAAPGNGAIDSLLHFLGALPGLNAATSAIGLSALAFLLLARRYAAVLLGRFLAPRTADLGARLAPMLAIVLGAAIVQAYALDVNAGVAVVGNVPSGLPAPMLPLPDAASLSALWAPALLIAVVGFVESYSVGRSLAARRGERIDANRELAGLGAGNLASAVSGGFPVTGGFARSVVNFAAGANTPLAGVVSAALMALVVLGMTDLFRPLPQAVLAATIIAAVLPLVDLATLRRAWRYDRADAWSWLVTAAGVLALGVEQGILIGVALSIGMLIWRTSHPHMALVGRVPGTEHFRNVERHQVETLPGLVAVRVDESLFFGNIEAVETRIRQLLAANPGARRLLLICSAVNHIDATALDELTALERELAAHGIELALAEVKGPVMDRLEATELGARLKGRVYLSTHAAFAARPA
jgi:SulP family sulfate permease